MPAPLGSVHVPPGSGVPPNRLTSNEAGAVLQSATFELTPASGSWFSVTVTVAVLFGQGATPATVYVNTSGASVAGSYVPLVAKPLELVHVPPTLGEPVSWS